MVKLCFLQAERGGFIQPVTGETKRCRQGGPLVDELLPPPPHHKECQPFSEAAGGDEGMQLMMGILITATFIFTLWSQDLTLSLLPPVCQVMNFSSPLMVPQGCWYILSLQLLTNTLPINQLFTLRLDTSLGTALHIPLYFHSTPFKVKYRLLCISSVGWASVHRSDVVTADVSQQGEALFEAERECGRSCPLRLSKTGETWFQKLE